MININKMYKFLNDYDSEYYDNPFSDYWDMNYLEIEFIINRNYLLVDNGRFYINKNGATNKQDVIFEVNNYLKDNSIDTIVE